MADYEESATMAAAPDDVFSYVSDVAHLPDFVLNMVLAQPEGDRLHVAADVHGRREEGPALFRADRDSRQVEWRGEGASQYRGWLRVTGADEGSSVTIHLRTAQEEDAEEIRRSLSDALTMLRRRVERP